MKTRNALYLAFTSLMGLMLVLISIGLYGMEVINQHIEGIVLSALAKVEYTSNMLHTARERSILMHRMVLNDDPFARDEMALELDRYGAEFAKSRTALLKMTLSVNEQLVLDEQGQLTSIAIPLQRKVIDLAAEDRIDEAIHSLTAAMPAQDAVLTKLKQLIILQQDYAEQASRDARQTYQQSRHAMLLLGLVVILISLVIARTFIRRISDAEYRLSEEKEKAQVTLRSIGDAVITTDDQGIIEYINNKAERLIGKFSGDIVGHPLSDVFDAFDVERKQKVTTYVSQYLSGTLSSQASSNIVLTSADGAEYHLSLALSPIIDAKQRVHGVVLTFNDVTKERNLLRQIKYQATRDALTGLYNRREFENKVKQSLSLYESHTNHAFCIIDLDRFKSVNDSCGHQAGDELLRQLSRLIRSMMRRGDLIARIGGDEFAMFLSNIDSQDALKLIDNILKAIIDFRFIWQDKTFRIGASIGVVEALPEVSDYDFLYHAADNACYLAKNEGRNQVRLMSIGDSVLQRAKEETDWLTKINRALDQDKLLLFGQSISPISRRAEGRHHIELLIRLLDDDGKIILPMAFIPTAERYGLMIAIDHYVLTKVCDYLKSHPLGHETFSVNLSGQTLSSITATERIVEAITECDIDAGRICFEVTETEAIANLENAAQFIEKIQKLGGYIALDDFGTGLSSFSYLKNLPLDYIKIDGTFIKDMAKEKSSLMMVDAIHSVGKKLGLMTVAEYVEDEQTLKLLKEIGVDFAQGYLIDKPTQLIPQTTVPNAFIA